MGRGWLNQVLDIDGSVLCWRCTSVFFSELEYARNLSRPIVPLKIQPRYNPDGWLAQVTWNIPTLKMTWSNSCEAKMNHQEEKKNSCALTCHIWFFVSEDWTLEIVQLMFGALAVDKQRTRYHLRTSSSPVIVGGGQQLDVRLHQRRQHGFNDAESGARTGIEGPVQNTGRQRRSVYTNSLLFLCHVLSIARFLRRSATVPLSIASEFVWKFSFFLSCGLRANCVDF